MSKNFYIGNGNIAREGQDIYVGVNGVARKVKSGYVGVNGVARKFWPEVTQIWYVWDRYRVITTYRWDKSNTAGEETTIKTYVDEDLGGIHRTDFYVGNSDIYIAYDGGTAGRDVGYYLFAGTPFLWTDGERYISSGHSLMYYIKSSPPENTTPYYTAYRIRKGRYLEFYLTRQNGYIYTDANYFVEEKVTTIKGTFIEYVYSKESNAYPNGGMLIDEKNYPYYYSNKTITDQVKGEFYSTVTSLNPSAYPNNGIQGNYWYVYKGTQIK